MDLLLDRLDRGVVVGGGHGLEGPPGASWVPEAAGRAGAGERILNGLPDGRTGGQEHHTRHCGQEAPPTTAPLPASHPARHHFPPPSRTAYPACDRLAAGEPPGHITISP